MVTTPAPFWKVLRFSTRSVRSGCTKNAWALCAAAAYALSLDSQKKSPQTISNVRIYIVSNPIKLSNSGQFLFFFKLAPSLWSIYSVINATMKQIGKNIKHRTIQEHEIISLLQAYYTGVTNPTFFIWSALHLDNSASVFIFVCVIVATGLSSYSPKVFRDPSEGFRDHFSESLTAAEGAGSILLFSLALACARIEAGSAELCHTLQRGHQQWEPILTPQHTQKHRQTWAQNHTHNIQKRDWQDLDCIKA